MAAHDLIRVLIQGRPVERHEPLRIGREVGRDPVHEHTDPSLMQRVDEVHQVAGASVSVGRREVAHHLVSPRAVVGMLHHRHELNMREAESLNVVRQRFGDLAVAEALAVLFVAPGSQVELVHGNRLRKALGPLPGLHPVVVSPIIGEIGNDTG